MLTLNQADHERVSAAVAAAEARSDAEIVAVVARRSDAYHDVGLHYAVLAMLLVPALWAALPQAWVDWGLSLVFGWNLELSRRALMTLLFVKLAVLFLLVRYALAWMPLRMALTPRATKGRRVRRRAGEIFRLSAHRRTVERTGVLLYLSLAERRAEIVADEAIDGKVKPEVWGEAMAALVGEVKAGRPAEGMAIAIERMGDVLAEHFPKTATDANELPDRLDRAMTEPEEVVWQGKYLAAKRKGKWEYVSRTRGISAAVILAVVDGDVLLVQQHRAPLDAPCLELPAGLVGDEQQGEAVEMAAARELEEETGYRADRIVGLGRFHASPGMSSEGFTLVRAEGLTKVSEGGGVEGEGIEVFRVPVREVPAFVEAKRREGVAIDAKLLLLLAPGLMGAPGLI